MTISNDIFEKIKKHYEDQTLYIVENPRTNMETECEFCGNKGKFAPVELYLCDSVEEKLDDPWGFPGFLIGMCCWKGIKEKLNETNERTDG